MTNPWVLKSIKLASSKGYLDQLHEVYPVPTPSPRQISREQYLTLQKLFESSEDVELIQYLLKNFEKFPINDPYVACLRRSEDLIHKNPRTVQRIATQLRKLGFQKVIEALQQPKETNRRMGTLFARWLREKFPLPVVALSEKPKPDLCVIQGTSNELLTFLNTALGCRLSKTPDVIIKVHRKFIVGEAKFIADYGGHQYTQLQDALSLFSKVDRRRVIPIAVLDGVVWLKTNSKMYRMITALSNDTALSALLLDDFVNTLANSATHTAPHQK